MEDKREKEELDESYTGKETTGDGKNKTALFISLVSFLLCIVLAIVVLMFCKGQQGEIGQKGENGIAGEKGETGDAGANGANGSDGINGVDGKTSYSSTILPSKNGTITTSNAGGFIGDSIDFTFKPDTNYTLASYSLNGIDYIPENYTDGETYTTSGLKIVANGYVVGARFEKIKYELDLVDALYGEDVICSLSSDNTTHKVSIGDTLNVTVNPSDGYYTVGLSVNDNQLFLTSDSNASLVDGKYVFALTIDESYIVDGKVSIQGVVAPIVTPTPDPDVVYDIVSNIIADTDGTNMYSIVASPSTAKIDDIVTLTITPTTGYEILGISINDVMVMMGDATLVANDDGSYTYVFIMSSDYIQKNSTTVTASAFAQKKAVDNSVKIYTADETKGTITLSVTDVEDFDTVTVTVNPLDGYKYEGIYDSDEHTLEISIDNIQYNDDGTVKSFDIFYSHDLDYLPFYVRFSENTDPTTDFMNKTADEMISIINSNIAAKKSEIDALSNVSVTTVFNYYKDTFQVDLFKVFEKRFENDTTYLVFDLTNRVTMLSTDTSISGSFHTDIYRVLTMEDVKYTVDETTKNVTYDLMYSNVDGYGTVLDTTFDFLPGDKIITHNSFELGNTTDANGNTIKKYVTLEYDNSLNSEDFHNIIVPVRIDLWYFAGESKDLTGWTFTNNVVNDYTVDDVSMIQVDVINYPTKKVNDLLTKGEIALGEGYFKDVSCTAYMSSTDTKINYEYIKVCGASIDSLSIGELVGDYMYFYFTSGTIGTLKVVTTSIMSSVSVIFAMDSSATLTSLNLDEAVDTTTVNIVPSNSSDNLSLVNRLKTYLTAYDVTVDESLSELDIYTITVTKKTTTTE